MVRHARNDCEVTAKGKPGSGVCKGFFFRNQLLQFVDKTADMKPVADGMVSLNGQRKQAAFLIGIIFPHGKNREQIIVTAFCRFRLNPSKVTQGTMETGKVFAGVPGFGSIPWISPYCSRSCR